MINISPINKPVKLIGLDFRDGQQSQIATRLTTDEILSVLPEIDNLGFEQLEVWGGATYDVCIRYLKEDPWERLRLMKIAAPKTPLKMVLRGQNLVGYRAYGDDVVEEFVMQAANHGIDVFLIFDALQDLRNCKAAFDAVKKAGKIIEGSVQYNISPVYTHEVILQSVKDQIKMGASAIHIEDMSGLMTPTEAYAITKLLKDNVDVPIYLHCHCTGGMAEMCYQEAIRAGIDGVDVCCAAFASGAAHPAAESIITALQGTNRDTGLDINKFASVHKKLTQLRKNHQDFESKNRGIDISVLSHQIPGGMLTNLENQLKDMGVPERLNDVLEEMVQVRKDMGYPPLATPSSQICGAQATFNILTGNRYSMVSKEMKNYCLGLYGKPMAPIDSTLMEKAIGDAKPFNKRPGELVGAELDSARAKVSHITSNPLDILTYALFEEIGLSYLQEKYSK